MKYQKSDSQQTLGEGLAEYYAAFPTLDRFADNDLRIIAKTFMAHDAVHVITGMDISPESEIILDTWQFWATYPGKDFWDSLRVTKEIFSDKPAAWLRYANSLNESKISLPLVLSKTGCGGFGVALFPVAERLRS